MAANLPPQPETQTYDLPPSTAAPPPPPPPPRSAAPRTAPPTYPATTNWPAPRVLAVVGAILGLTMALFLLGGSFAASAPLRDLYDPATADILGAVAGSIALSHVALAVFSLVSAVLLLNNVRLHGGLLVLWGLLGTLTGFGLFLGGLLVLAGGILALLGRGFGGAVGPGRRPSV